MRGPVSTKAFLHTSTHTCVHTYTKKETTGLEFREELREMVLETESGKFYDWSFSTRKHYRLNTGHSWGPHVCWTVYKLKHLLK